MKHGWPVLTAGVLPVIGRTALASEEAHGHGGGIPIAALIFSTINLLIFGYLLARFAMPTVRNWVRGRRARVVTALDEAAVALAEAKRLRGEWEARLAQFDAEMAALRDQARHDAERERERILEAAQRTAASIRRDAERAAAYELRRTQQQLRAELVRRAVQLAEEDTRARWSSADQQRAVADFLKQVPR